MARDVTRCARRQAPWLALVLLAAQATATAQTQGNRSRRRAAPPVDFVLPSTPGKAPPPSIPGFEPEPQGGKKKNQGPAPVGPKPKPVPPAPKPVDPMHAADEVTAQADHRSQQEEAELAQLAEHFRICDLDGNGWLSLREAEVTLSLDRGEFRRADATQDGRIDAQEFASEKDVLLARLGALPAPARPAPAPAPAVPTAPPAEPAPSARPGRSELSSMRVMPGEILQRYDGDRSKGIGPEELAKFFLEVGLTLSPELVIAQMDPNDSGELEASELVAIAWMASQHLPKALRSASPEVAPSAPDEAAPAAAAREPGAEPAARTAAGLTHFGRLDADGDGFIDEADLRKLQSPARIDVRLKAILSALDRDGDGRLTEAEFRASMGDEPR